MWRRLLQTGLVLTMIALAPEFEQFRDFETLSAAHWYVQARNIAVPQRFRFTATQRIIEYEKRKLRDLAMMVRMKILKMRQGGVSTYCTGDAQHFCMTNRGCNALSIADKLVLPSQWLTRARRWYDQTPDIIKPVLAKSNSYEMYFSRLDSRYLIGSQLGQTPGMGMTLPYVHCSELADWRNPTKVMDDLGPSIPKNNPMATLIFEGTGWMVGDWWFEQIMKTLHGDDDFVLVFLPWFIMEDYSEPPVGVEIDFTEQDYTPEEKHLVEIANVWTKARPDHAVLADFQGITPGHIAWRRWTVRNEFSGDVERFASKYPATVEEAFLSSDALGLPLQIVLHHQETCIPHLRHVRFRRGGGGVVAEDCEPIGPHWTIFKEPKEYCEYAVGGDPAEGKLSDQTNGRSERDNSAAAVIDRRTLEYPASFVGKIAADLFGRELMMAGEYYNRAYLGGEVNNNGWATVTECKHYPNMLYRSGPPDTIKDRDINELWFKTTPGPGGTRNQLINTWIAGCRYSGRSGWNNSIRIFDTRLVGEEKTFITKPNGKKEHRDGCFDDLLFAHMLAYWTHLNTPHVRREAMGHIQPLPDRKKMRAGHAYAGSVDQFEDMA